MILSLFANCRNKQTTTNTNTNTNSELDRRNWILSQPVAAAIVADQRPNLMLILLYYHIKSQEKRELTTSSSHYCRPAPQAPPAARLCSPRRLGSNSNPFSPTSLIDAAPPPPLHRGHRQGRKLGFARGCRIGEAWAEAGWGIDQVGGGGSPGLHRWEAEQIGRAHV